MNLTTEHTDGVAIVRVGETRLMYPLLSEFADAVTALVKSGERKILIDLSPVVLSIPRCCSVHLTERIRHKDDPAQGRKD